MSNTNNRMYDLFSNLLTSEINNYMNNLPTATSTPTFTSSSLPTPTFTSSSLPTVSKNTLQTTLIQSDNRIIAYVEMPGFDKQSIDLDFHNNKLIVTGMKEQPVLLDEEKTSFSNVVYGAFSTTIKLPVLVTNKEKVNVKYDNGVLRIVIALEREEQNRFTINFMDDVE